MHFDQRTQRAIREQGLDLEALKAASAAVVEAVADDADALETFFDDHDTVYSDMSMAHSRAEFPEHAVEYADITTHGGEMRGWLRFDSWGAYVEDGRILGDDYVELTLGPTIHDRVRFAADRETLR